MGEISTVTPVTSTLSPLAIGKMDMFMEKRNFASEEKHLYISRPLEKVFNLEQCYLTSATLRSMKFNSQNSPASLAGLGILGVLVHNS